MERPETIHLVIPMSSANPSGRTVGNVPAPAPSWTVQLFYDGTSPQCVQEIQFWQERHRMSSPLRRIKVQFVDVAQPSTLASETENDRDLSFSEVSGTIVGRLPDGQILKNPALFEYLKTLLGVGLLYQSTRLPMVGGLMQGWYQNWAKEKLPLTTQQSLPQLITSELAEPIEENFLQKNDREPEPETLELETLELEEVGLDLEGLDAEGLELEGWENRQDIAAAIVSGAEDPTFLEEPTQESLWNQESELDEEQLFFKGAIENNLTGTKEDQTIGLDNLLAELEASTTPTSLDSLDSLDSLAIEQGFEVNFELPDWLEVNPSLSDSPDIHPVEILGLADLEIGLEEGLDFLGDNPDDLDLILDLGVDLSINLVNDSLADNSFANNSLANFSIANDSVAEETFGSDWDLTLLDFDLENGLDEPWSITEDLPAVESDQLTSSSDWEALDQLLEQPQADPTPITGSSFSLSSLKTLDLPNRVESSNFMDTFIEAPQDLESDLKVSLPIGEFMNISQNRSKLRSGRVDQNMKVSVRQLDNLGDLIAEMVVSRNCMEAEHERARQFLNNLLYQMQQLSDVGQRLRDLYERSLLENALLSSRQTFNVSGNVSGRYIQRSNAPVIQKDTQKDAQKDFDALEMDHFSEFHHLSQEMIELIVRARESASDIDYVINEPLDYIARHFRQVTTQVQEGLTRTRMVPFEQGTTRLPRAIREVASRSGKQARLVVEGRDTLIDKVLLEQLYDPLTHLINNAVSHGIESSSDREQMGKHPCGIITLRAFYQGNQTVIVVEDDGAGIDADRVREKAFEKGLLNLMEAQTFSDLQLYDLLFHPGFSTRDRADDFSGRGVGMDVVKTRIDQIRGTISVDSTRGKGSKFTIRLPLTLSITKALCCISNRARMAFPMDSVEDMLDLHRDQVKVNADNETYIPWRDRQIPLKQLPELLHYNHQTIRSTIYAGGNPDEDMLSVVILRMGGDNLGLQVDWVEGEKEIVIKQLEGPVPKPPGIAGVTVLSDGQILPIADVLELMEMAKGRFRQSFGSLWYHNLPAAPAPVIAPQPIVLIVDDSITVRELLSMTFNKSNYRVEQARDGREAWEKLRSGLPCDLIFCDIEMPRMTGLELLEKLQHDPQLGKIPIAMLTSRGADRHRQMAIQLGARAYFTKPYLEEVLLEAAQRMLQGEHLVK